MCSYVKWGTDVARRTASGLVPLVLVVGVVVLFGSQLLHKADDLFGGSEPVAIGDGDNKFLVAPDGESAVKQCTAQQLMAAKRCGDAKVLIIDAVKMPFIARNIKLAWSSNKAAVLHRDQPENRQAHYDASCGRKSSFVAKYPGVGSCDEFEFASSQEGGADARTEEVPRREQNCQGATIKNAYYGNPGIAVGEAFVVVIIRPGSIADQPFEGVDKTKEQACEL